MSQVSDFNVANASGASVRADINAILDAIKTCNSGGNDPTNAQAFMLYGDTSDSNKLKVRNSSNNGFTEIGSVDQPNLGLLPVAGGSLSGQVLAHSGAGEASPAIAFVSDTGTGFFRPASNTLGFSTAGTQRVGISNAGLDMLNALPIRFQDSSGSPFVSLQSPSSLSGNVALTLPSSITNGGFLQTDGSGNLSFQIVNGVPSGAVFCVAVAVLPTGYLKCNGNAVSRTDYAALFAFIGTTYGNGDGSSTFNVPDLRGEFVRGFDDNRGVDSGRSINDPQSDSNKQHNHSVDLTTSNKSLTGQARGISESFNNGGSADGVFSKQNGFTVGQTPGNPDNNDGGAISINASHDHTVTGNTGNSGSETRPRNIAMMYIIKV